MAFTRKALGQGPDVSVKIRIAGIRVAVEDSDAHGVRPKFEIVSGRPEYGRPPGDRW